MKFTSSFLYLALNLLTEIECHSTTRLRAALSSFHRFQFFGAMHLNGGSGRAISNRERWESAGFSLQPDFGPEAHPDVPLEHRLGDAAEYGDIDALRRLIQVRGTHMYVSMINDLFGATIKQAGANVNAADWGGFTALHRAAFNGNLDCVIALLDAGALPNSRDIVGGRTPMHQAAGNHASKKSPL